MREFIQDHTCIPRPRKISQFAALFVLLSTTATAQSADDSTPLQLWLRCSADTYKAKREVTTFDRKALVASWTGCKTQRDAVLATVPEEQRESVGRMLEGINDSVVAELVAAENQRPGYGLNRNQPVKVGGGWQEGVMRAVRYLEQLRGPDGQSPTIVRVGSCCAFDTPYAQQGRKGRLEVYDVSYSDLKEPVTVYVNTYEEGELDIVKGFGRATEQEESKEE